MATKTIEDLSNQVSNEQFDTLKNLFFKKLEVKSSYGRAEIREIFLLCLLEVVFNSK